MRYSFLVALLLVSVTTAFAFSGMSYAPFRSLVVEPGSETKRAVAPPPLHNARDFITRSDAILLATRKLAPPGTKSLLSVPAVMRHGDYVWHEEGVRTGKIAIWVDLRRQMISAFRDGHEIGTSVIVYGAEDRTSPEGRFPILSKKRQYHSRTYDAPMPASLFITDDGVALHGSPMSSRRASHGCIGLPIKFAEKLFDATQVGDIVEITRSQETEIGLPRLR